ncbi:hypothetical protein K435DRAFT_781363 [Dendrothele bispora CBS 962.96]|uniref:Uncharacterized protein n=1 Tax=Dendrothele bispora (strain CBS 962.96) TaxID=1314807 RepID=A0A4S8LME4_DENBC|nr:hypothetical protein K435DRAFT_781363 [Dendrothele bispora CBS 962.96]
MSSTLVVPQGLSYVASALLSTSFLLVWQDLTVNRTPKAVGIPYPQCRFSFSACSITNSDHQSSVYAEKSEAAASPAAMKFNSQDETFSFDTPLSQILVDLARHKIAAVAVGIWTVSRIAYSRGHLTGNPDKRINPIGLNGSLVTIGLISSSAFTVYQIIVEGI